VRIAKEATVGERVGRDVHDAHEQRSVTKRQLVLPAHPDTIAHEGIVPALPNA
jgi:hypothetical protein